MQGSHTTSDKPQLLCEIGADRVIAARAARVGGGLDAHSSKRLATGTIQPGVAQPNIQRSDALRDTLIAALGEVAGKSRDVTVILPDASVRVLLLDFESLPDDGDEALNVIRFRVRKSIPFNADRAAVSYDVQRSGKAWCVIAALSPREIVDEYEDLLRSAGYKAGIVVPSVLATLGLVDVTSPTLLVKMDVTSTTLALLDKNQLLQVRTLEFYGEGTSGARLAEEIHPSLVFHEDTFGRKVDRILLAGMGVTPGLGVELQQQSGLPVEEVTADSKAGSSFGDPLPHSALCGVLGALQS